MTFSLPSPMSYLHDSYLYGSAYMQVIFDARKTVCFHTNSTTHLISTVFIWIIESRATMTFSIACSQNIQDCLNRKQRDARSSKKKKSKSTHSYSYLLRDPVFSSAFCSALLFWLSSASARNRIRMLPTIQVKKLYFRFLTTMTFRTYASCRRFARLRYTNMVGQDISYLLKVIWLQGLMQTFLHHLASAMMAHSHCHAGAL